MIIVMTTRRPGVSYLEATLAGIEPACPREKLIVSDGPLPDGFTPPVGWEVVVMPWRGARATGWACLAIALERGVPDLILLQDDLAICDGGTDVMHRAPVPDNAVAVTFYSCHWLPGLWRRPAGPERGPARYIVIGAAGTGQALKLPRRSLEFLCAQDPLKAQNIRPEEPHLFDDSLFAFGRESPWPHVAHLVPNPVMHVGTVSACDTRRGFNQPWAVGQGERFPGDVTALPVDLYPYPGAPKCT